MLAEVRAFDPVHHLGEPATSSIPIPVKTLHLDADELALNFEQCLKLANAAADHLLAKQGGAMLLSFWDEERALESPHGVSECHFQCPIPGWQDYAANRGGSLMVNYGRGRYVFCYRPLAEHSQAD